MDYAGLPTPRPFGATSRLDGWWLQPTLTILGLGAFIVYSTWAAFQGNHYEHGNLLSPMYSPLLFGDSPHAWFGSGPPSWWPGALPFSAALLILWAPGGFRFTCYYYRGAYYKAFWGDPPNCAVGEPRKGYRGEQKLPLIFQNIHRYFLYLAVLFVVLLAWDALYATRFATPEGGTEFGISVGTLVLAANAALLGSYTFGCHSLRHLVGGRKDQLSQSPACLQAWRGVTWLNVRHMLFAWISLLWVGFSDLYVRLCSQGIWHDLRIL
jgi:hypothetical protein